MAASALQQRVLTAVVGLALLLPAFLLMPPVVGDVLLAGLFMLAAWEWAGFTRPAHALARVAGALFIISPAVVWQLSPQLAPPPQQLAEASLLWWVVALMGIARFPFQIGPAATLLSGMLVLVPGWVSMAVLLGAGSGGRQLLLFALAMVWAADIGAYFSGRRFGRLKLAPQVSPGKTWEGFFGGLVLAAATAGLGATLLGHAPAMAAVAGVAVAMISVVGDLTESVFKRNAGLKDSGRLFPGHGGVLDRMDSIAAAMPLFLLLAGWLGWFDA